MEPASAKLLREYAQMLFEDQPDAVLIHQRGRVIYANGPLGLLLGVPPRALYGRPAADVYPERERAAASARLETAAAGEPTPVARHRLRRCDGTPVSVVTSSLRLPIDGDDSLVVEVLRRAPGEA
jgi:PAS domain S-box-containing protein